MIQGHLNIKGEITEKATRLLTRMVERTMVPQ